MYHKSYYRSTRRIDTAAHSWLFDGGTTSVDQSVFESSLFVRGCHRFYRGGVLRTGVQSDSCAFYGTMTDGRNLTPHTEPLRALPDDEEIFDPLMNLRRRTIIRYMGQLSTDAAVETSELARVCAAVERDLPLHKVNHRTYRHAYQAVRQRDVPCLAEAGILVKHDRDTITRGERFPEFIELLEAIDAHLE